MALFSTVAALSLSLAWAATAGEVPGLIEERELRLPLCPVSVELDRSGLLEGVRFVFVPLGYRTACQGRTIKECREVSTKRAIARHARRKAEPDQILEVVVGARDRSLLAALSVAPAVRKLRERKDVTWIATGKPQEYPLDKRRVVKALLRWRVFVNGEQLEFLGLVK